MTRKLKTNELGRLSVDEFKEADKLPVTVVLDNIRSGNNVGSVFRTSDALRIERIILCGITATPPNKEIHKTAIGAEKSIDWEYYKQTEEAVQKLKSEGYRIAGVEQVKNSTLLPDFKVSADIPLALVFGNEVKGVQQQIIDMCDENIEIPQYGTKHSFNISVSAGIVLWDICNKMRR